MGKRILYLLAAMTSIFALFCAFYLRGILTVASWKFEGLKRANIEEFNHFYEYYGLFVENSQEISLLSMDPLKAISYGFRSLFDVGSNNYFLGLLLVILVIVALMKLWTYLLLYKDYIPLFLQRGGRVLDKKNTFGSARFSLKKDISNYKKGKYLGIKSGIPLGTVEPNIGNNLTQIREDLVTIPDNPRFNENVFVYAPPGEGKTYTFVKTLIMNILCSTEKYKSSFILNDSKGDIYKDFGRYLREKHKYNVVLINLISLKNSNHFNPIDFIDSEQDAQIVVDMILKNTKIDEDMKGASDPFWSEAEEAIFISTILLFKFEYNIDSDLGMIYDFLNDNSYVELNKHFDKIADHRPCKRIYKSFMKIKEEHRGNMIFGLCTRLKLFALNEVRDFTSRTDFDIYDLKKTNTALFFVIPDTNTSMNYLLVVIKAILAEKLVKFIDSSKDDVIRNRKIIQVDDEIANTGIIPQYKYWINTFRSRKWVLIPIFQNLNQPKEMFGDQWISVYTACHTKVCIGVNDPETAEFVSKELGTQSIRVMTKFKEAGVTNMLSDERWSQADQKRELMTPDELQRMDINCQIVLRRGCQPMKLYKLGWESYSEMAAEAQSIQESIFDYVPLSKGIRRENIFDFS